jgi:peptidoglycan hydrolase-like protein with peptidoglycan-binding domain
MLTVKPYYKENTVMTTVAHNIVAKLSVAFVAVAMLFTLVSPAKAATAEEMQQMINDLLAQVASLQGSVAQGGSSAGMCPYTWTRGLKTGDTGMDVMKLQQFLNSDADTRVSASGVGSAGMETEYFGPATAAAVSKFQVKYRSDILSPAGLVNPTGFFGPGSMAKANALCVGGSMSGGDDSSDDDMSDDSDDSDDEMSGDLSGEASLDDVQVEDGDDTEIEEGQEDAPVADIDVEFTDGDAMITRMDIALEKTATVSGQDNDPWDVIETVSLWVDGDKVAEMDASDEDEYLDEDDGSLRFAGLDIVAMEDEEVTITVGVTVQGSVDNITSTDSEWYVSAEAIRFVDADDVTTTEEDQADLRGDNTGDRAEFAIGEEGGEDELIVKSSSEDPDATTLTLEDDQKSDWITIFAYTLDTDDSENDIVVNDIRVNVAGTEDGSTGTSTALLINDAQLVIGGEEYDDVTIVHGVGGTFSFDLDGDLEIAAGESVGVEFQVEFKALPTELEGATVQASTTSDVGYDAEGADDLDSNQLDGAATGDEHTLRTSGAVLELTDSSTSLKENSDSTTADDEGVFTLEFDVTAFEGDLYIDDTAVRGTSFAGDEGANFVITTGGVATTSGTAVPTLDSDAELDGGRFKVAEGETESFTLTVEYLPAASASYKVQLYSVNFRVDTNGLPDTEQLALPEEDFDSASLTI